MARGLFPVYSNVQYCTIWLHAVKLSVSKPSIFCEVEGKDVLTDLNLNSLFAFESDLYLCFSCHTARTVRVFPVAVFITPDPVTTVPNRLNASAGYIQYMLNLRSWSISVFGTTEWWTVTKLYGICISHGKNWILIKSRNLWALGQLYLKAERLAIKRVSLTTLIIFQNS
jgi:hypothetical protein